MCRTSARVLLNISNPHLAARQGGDCFRCVFAMEMGKLLTFRSKNEKKYGTHDDGVK
jgi:hypothetical protein